MKLLFTWMCICLPVIVCAHALPHRDQYQPGYLYYDALTLADANVGADVKMAILAAYRVNKDNIEDNRYLAPLYAAVAPPRTLRFDDGGNLLSGIGNLDVTNIAEGLARFLAARAKEELDEAFFKKLKNTLDAYPELTTAFPRTTLILGKIDTYTYSSVLQVLKESFEIDVKNLPADLYDITHLTIASCGGDGKEKDDCEKRLKALQAFFDKRGGKLTALGLYVAKEGTQATNPATFLNTVATSEELLAVKTDGIHADENAAAMVMLGNLFSQSLLSKEDRQLWIDANKLKALLKADNDYQVFKTFIGLLVAKIAMADDVKSKISFHVQGANVVKGMDEILNNNYTRFKDLLQVVQDVHTGLATANMAVSSLLAANDKQVVPSDQQFFNYYQAFFITVKTILHNKLLAAWTGTEVSAKLSVFESYLDPAVDVAYRLELKQYSSAVYDVLILLNNLSDPDKGGNQDLADLQKQFNKYAPFIAAAASAQSSDEVKQVIEANAMPAGGSAVKRQAAFSATINGFVGPYWDAHKTDYNSRFGLTAPIGVNFSWAWRDSKKGLRELGIASAGVNLQLFDLGALVNYYLINGDSANPSKDFSVKLANVFAPGASACANIRGLPLSIAAGGQYVPVLYNYKQIDGGATQLKSSSGWRWQVSVLVDIPLITLVARDFKKAATIKKAKVAKN